MIWRYAPLAGTSLVPTECVVPLSVSGGGKGGWLDSRAPPSSPPQINPMELKGHRGGLPADSKKEGPGSHIPEIVERLLAPGCLGLRRRPLENENNVEWWQPFRHLWRAYRGRSTGVSSPLACFLGSLCTKEMPSLSVIMQPFGPQNCMQISALLYFPIL